MNKIAAFFLALLAAASLSFLAEAASGTKLVKPTNLAVNTKADEDDPFLSSGGLTLWYSCAPSSPVDQVQQMIGALYQMAASQNPQEANALVMDEIFQAVDTFIDTVGKELGMNFNMQGSIAAYQNAINHNPLEHSQIGQILGSLVSDLTYYMLETGQA
jgi:hypothetical protein